MLVDVGCLGIPNNKAKLHTAGKILWRGSFRVGMFEVEGDEIDIVAVREEKNTPIWVSNRT